MIPHLALSKLAVPWLVLLLVCLSVPAAAVETSRPDGPSTAFHAGHLDVNEFLLGPIEAEAIANGRSDDDGSGVELTSALSLGNVSVLPNARPYGPEQVWTLMPHGLIYQPYLASAKESRFRSVWSDERRLGSVWDVTLGGQVGLLRYGSTGDRRPTGIQLGIEGAGLVRLDPDENMDVDAADFRFGIPLTWGDEVVQMKFGYYHLSSHLGDEFLLKHPNYPRLNFSRDVLVWGVSICPSEVWRVYSEIGYAFYSDVAKKWEFQFGVEYAPQYATGAGGAPFFAANGHLREELNFGGNVVLQGGWAWRRSPASGMLRTGIELYNGKSEQFSFYDQFERKIGFGIWYDY